ncbi:MAG: four helix bundle protein [Patescibacteria group bacterium]|nr:four helix bundle protein [Patescibacteria group bacterium]
MLVINNNYHSFEDVKVWQLARKFRKLIYNISNNFPKKENYCLTSQMRRAAISIHSNIARGMGVIIFKKIFNFAELPEVR